MLDAKIFKNHLHDYNSFLNGTLFANDRYTEVTVNIHALVEDTCKTVVSVVVVSRIVV